MKARIIVIIRWRGGILSIRRARVVIEPKRVALKLALRRLNTLNFCHLEKIVRTIRDDCTQHPRRALPGADRNTTA